MFINPLFTLAMKKNYRNYLLSFWNYSLRKYVTFQTLKKLIYFIYFTQERKCILNAK